jgi:hypothetical protein
LTVPTEHRRSVPDAARRLAARLGGLLDRDRELVVALNAAQRRLLDANARLSSGLSARALRDVYGPAGPDQEARRGWRDSTSDRHHAARRIPAAA